MSRLPTTAALIVAASLAASYLLYRYSRSRSKQRPSSASSSPSHPPPRLIVIFSGKRKSGKDYVTDRLLEQVASAAGGTDVCSVGRLSGPLKKAYADENGLDYKELLSDGPYKERYRADMIVWGERKAGWGGG